MSQPVVAYVDPTCPYSYMLFASLQRLAQDTDLELSWRAVALRARPKRGSRAAAAEAAMREAAHRATWPSIQALARRDYGLSLAQPGCETDPRPACVALIHVRHRAPERVTDVLGRLFAAHFERDVDADPDAPSIDDPAVLARLIHETGVSVAGLAGALSPDQRSRLLAEDQSAAQAEGLSAVPALRTGDHLLLGAQPPAVLRGALLGASIAGGAAHDLHAALAPAAAGATKATELTAPTDTRDV
jgi:predicted DsbA family dithiol-disulfide isomerase